MKILKLVALAALVVPGAAAASDQSPHEEKPMTSKTVDPPKEATQGITGARASASASLRRQAAEARGRAERHAAKGEHEDAAILHAAAAEFDRMAEANAR